ncbi:MAG: hypothetical protein ACI4IW_04520 [Oscillospiraceae bacterium]
MQQIDNFKYVIHFYGTYKNGFIQESQQTLLTANEMFEGGSENTIVPKFEHTHRRIKFDTNTILSDFIKIGKISDNENDIKYAKTMYVTKYNKTAKTLDEFREAKQKVNILDTDFPVELKNDWYQTPIFMNRDCHSPLCPNIDTAKAIWRIAFRFLEMTNGLSKPQKNILINEFERFRSYNDIQLDYKISYSISSPLSAGGKLSEYEFIKNQTNGYSEDYEYICNNAKEIVFAVLHYYIINGFYLKKCELCGKYFFPQEKQEAFCNNKFSYIDWEGKTKDYPSCKIARIKIRERSDKRYHNIYNKLSERCNEYGYIDGILFKEFNDFANTAAIHRENIKQLASIDNIVKYETFLYIDCSKYDKRYSRR